MQKIEINLLQEQEPRYENKVILDNELDPLGIPKSTLFWKKDLLFKKTGRSIVEQVAEFVVKNNLGRIAINEYLYKYQYLQEKTKPQDSPSTLFAFCVILIVFHCSLLKLKST